ncbi:S8 family serine peptidase [Solirubrobacter soli]|uniref:S8 family serine peptidase n=1 Tax=Solirubrobacter soli TaxID=363832 RepID=UPI000409730C|nr:S8 family serine peptidase [Solirubrobacter soli]
MRTFIVAVVALFGIFAGTAQAAPPAATHIVQLRSGVSLAAGKAAVRAVDGDVADTLPIINGLAVRLTDGARERLAHDTRVASISANAALKSQSDRFDPTQLATAYPASVYAPTVWNGATGATGAGVGVAVIDTGINGGLVDFSDADGHSRVVASVVTSPEATTPNDDYGHGTHVAGIIAGDGTRRPDGDPLKGRYVGVAPDANLIAIKASDDDGEGTLVDAIYGLQFVVDHKADYNIRVVNLSVSSTTAESYHTDPLDAAVEAAYFHGIVVVTAAGNKGHAADAVNYAPGNDPYVISVGAVDDQGTTTRGDDAYAAWSSAGTTQDGFAKPDIAAPGAHIVSTFAPGSVFGQLCPQCIVDGSYIQIGGTSMAAPVVAGVAALVLQAHPDWTPDQVKSTLMATGRDVPGAIDEVNASAAISVAEPASGANSGLVPNDLIDPTTGNIDETRSSWGRSSWGRPETPLAAGWTNSNWGCVCPGWHEGVDRDTRSSWGSATWLVKWNG